MQAHKNVGGGLPFVKSGRIVSNGFSLMDFRENYQTK